MAQAAKNDLSELNADVSKQMAVLRADIASLTEIVSDFGAAQGKKLKANAKVKAADLSESSAATAAALKTKAEDAYTDAEDAVRANPSAAVGIAAGIGFVVGMLSARR